MKKTVLAIIFAALMSLSCIACSPEQKKPAEAAPAQTAQQPTEAPAAEPTAEPTAEPATDPTDVITEPALIPPAECRTIGDVMDYDSPSSGAFEDLFIYVFEADGAFYRAEADITPDIFQQMFDIDFFDPDKDQKTRDLVKDLPIKKLYNLSEVLLSQADLDALTGKTGQELLDMGFVPSGSYGFGEDVSLAYLVKGPFEYEIEFVEHVTPGEDPNVAEVIRPMTVKIGRFNSVSDYAVEHDFDLHGGPTLEEDNDVQTSYDILEIPLEESEFKTLADAFACKWEYAGYSVNETKDTFVYVFQKDGVYYRVEADMTPELDEQLDALDFFDEQYDEKMAALLGDQPIRRVANLSAGIPSQEELDALIGMTGQELLDMGFGYGSGYSFDSEAEIYLELGLYEYHFYFNEKVPKHDDYDAVLDDIMKSLTVKKAEFFRLTDVCTDPDLAY